jgi:hypothetical protein
MKSNRESETGRERERMYIVSISMKLRWTIDQSKEHPSPRYLVGILRLKSA